MSFDAFSVDLNVNSSSDHHFATASDHHDDTYSRYGGYSSFTGVFPSDGDVAVDHTAAASPEIYGFSDQNPGYSQSPFESVIAENENENGNGYGDGDDIFVADGPVLPPPGEMEPEEGYVLREWRRYSWLIKRTFTKMRRKLIGKQLQSSFLARYPSLKSKEAKRIKRRSHQLQLFKAPSLANPLILQE